MCVGLAARLERDVVVGRAAAARGRRGEVADVGRDVALRREAASVLSPAAMRTAEELIRVGDDLDRLAVVALLVLPLAPLEATVDRDRAALGEVLGGVLALRAPDGDVEVVRPVDTVAGRVLATRVRGDAQAAD